MRCSTPRHLKTKPAPVHRRGGLAFAVFCLTLIGTAPALAQTGNADAAKALAELSTIEAELSASLAKGDAAGLWLARRSLNAAALAADFADRKPAEAEYACFDARTALADVATAGITAIAADTIQGAAGMEARLASRKDVDDAAGLYNSMRAACAKGAGIETPSALKAPVAAGIPSLPVAAEAMLDPAAKSAMAGALAGLVTAEKALGDAVVDKPASSKDPAFGRVSRLFSLLGGRRRRFRNCRHCGLAAASAVRFFSCTIWRPPHSISAPRAVHDLILRAGKTPWRALSPPAATPPRERPNVRRRLMRAQRSFWCPNGFWRG